MLSLQIVCRSFASVLLFLPMRNVFFLEPNPNPTLA